MGRWNLLERRVARFLKEPPSIREAAGVIVTATAVVVVGAGFLITLVDEKEYSNLGVGLWWAVQTVTTVGYGDVAPSAVSGRLVAAAVMLYGIAFIAIVTALITSTFVARAAQEHEDAQARVGVSDRELIERRFDELERKVDAIAAARGPEGA
jgi:voltage-gated potassium channel Kch